MPRKKIELGDLFQLATNRGYIYMQCVGIPEDRRQHVELIRIYYDIHLTPITDLSRSQKSSFFYLNFVLQAAYNRKIVEKVGHAPLEPHFEAPRYFRTKHHLGEGWQIVDSETM